MRCCCGGNGNRKRNQGNKDFIEKKKPIFNLGFNTIPQPIIIHTNSPPNQAQYYQQQQAPSPMPAPQSWHLENHPMLPQPSAPPRPNDESYVEPPPAYEKICAS